MRRSTSTLEKELLYIHSFSDKGDCIYCLEGVLYRDTEVEEAFEVNEGYKCDTCGNAYIEAYLFSRRKPWEKRVPRRFFTVVE